MIHQAIWHDACKNDILLFFEYFLYTENTLANLKQYYKYEAPKIPFLLFPKQKELILSMWESIIEGTKPYSERRVMVDKFVEKCRQVGASWMIAGIYLYGFLFHNHKYLVVSYNQTQVDQAGDMKSFFEKLRFMIRELPQWMLPPAFDKSSATQYNKTGVISRKDGAGSITGEVATEKAGRGGNYNDVLMDEMAFMMYAKAINTGLSINPRTFISTPNGENTEYYEMRKLAV
jgi:phage terminase large subunit